MKSDMEPPASNNTKMNPPRAGEGKGKNNAGPDNNNPSGGPQSGGGGGHGDRGGYGGGGGGGGPQKRPPNSGKSPRYINDNSGNYSNYNNFQRQRMANSGNNFSIPGPTTNLQTKDGEPKKFIGRCRLFVGNLTPDMDEAEFRKMFEPFGAISEVFLSAQKGFGFVKMDTRASAEAARNQLDGSQRKGRVLRVRFATHGSAIKVRNLSSFVSNELLEKAFSLFGEVERAIVIVDDRGKPTGDGIVEYARKHGAQMALKRCGDGCFMLTASPKPVIVEPYEQKDDEDGLPEKLLPKNSNNYLKERDIGPRFAQQNSFEFEFGQKWKQVYEMEKQKRASLETEILNDRERLDDQMEFAIYEHETNMLREKLRQREQDANNLLREREMRRHERLREDENKRQDMMRYQEKFGMMRNDEMRRRQEDSLLLQANHLNSLLDQQEAALRQMQGGGGGGNAGGSGAGNSGGGGSIGVGNSGSPSVGRPGAGGSLGGNSGGPAGPVMPGSMNLGGGGGLGNSNMVGQSGPGGPGSMGGGQMTRQSRFEQPSGSGAGMMGPGPANHMNRGMGPMGGGGGGQGGGGGGGGGGGPPMGGPMGDLRGGAGGGMVRRDLMDRRDHRDDYADAKRRRF